jgi:hypothetical protein
MGTINGKGANDIFNSYGIQDMQPYNGIAYYRLLQKSKTAVAFADIKVVDRSSVAESYYTIYPNPVHGILNINLMSITSEKTTVEIFDIAGRKILLQEVPLSKGMQNISLDMSKLQNGSYILKLMLDGKMKTQIVNKF